MYRGQVTILRGNPMMNKVFIWGMVLLVPLGVTIALVPEEARKTVSTVLIACYVGAYVALLSRGLTPLREVVELQADPRGLFTPARCVVARADIVQAYLRPPVEAQSVKGVQIAAWPLTVELVTTTGQLNLDPGGEPAAHAILTALGFAVTMVPATHVAQTAQNKRSARIGWLVVIGVAIGLLIVGGTIAFFAQ